VTLGGVGMLRLKTIIGIRELLRVARAIGRRLRAKRSSGEERSSRMSGAVRNPRTKGAGGPELSN